MLISGWHLNKHVTDAHFAGCCLLVPKIPVLLGTKENLNFTCELFHKCHQQLWLSARQRRESPKRNHGGGDYYSWSACSQWGDQVRTVLPRRARSASSLWKIQLDFSLANLRWPSKWDLQGVGHMLSQLPAHVADALMEVQGHVSWPLPSCTGSSCDIETEICKQSFDLNGRLNTCTNRRIYDRTPQGELGECRSKFDPCPSVGPRYSWV
jgi:hypothetical protein